MKLGLLPLLALSLLFLLGAAAPVRMTPVKVTDGVYMLEHSQGSGNSTVGSWCSLTATGIRDWGKISRIRSK